MGKVAAYHSTLAAIQVYHDNDKCTEGNNIERRNWKAGKGGKRLCRRCETLNLKK